MVCKNLFCAPVFIYFFHQWDLVLEGSQQQVILPLFAEDIKQCGDISGCSNKGRRMGIVFLNQIGRD